MGDETERAALWRARLVNSVRRFGSFCAWLVELEALPGPSVKTTRNTRSGKGLLRWLFAAEPVPGPAKAIEPDMKQRQGFVRWLFAPERPPAPDSDSRASRQPFLRWLFSAERLDQVEAPTTKPQERRNAGR